jgi:exodeoxyribonuclease VII large subunit
VVALVRGGGARSDLATFDSEAVARAIAGLRVPVLTGIGHEVDDSVADRVAHQAHKTPTACATSLVERVLSFRRELDDGARQLRAAAAGRLDQAERRVGALGGTITGLARTAVDTAQVRLTHGAEQLVRGAGRPLDRADAAATIRADRLPAEARRGLRDRERDLDHRAAQLRVLDPDRLLARGWTITRTADGEPLRTIDRLEPGTRLLTTFADGEARSTVDAIETATQEGAGHGH